MLGRLRNIGTRPRSPGPFSRSQRRAGVQVTAASAFVRIAEDQRTCRRRIWLWCPEQDRARRARAVGKMREGAVPVPWGCHPCLSLPMPVPVSVPLPWPLTNAQCLMPAAAKHIALLCRQVSTRKAHYYPCSCMRRTPSTQHQAPSTKHPAPSQSPITHTPPFLIFMPRAATTSHLAPVLCDHLCRTTVPSHPGNTLPGHLDPTISY